ncbi:MAG TPA: hypothetical protein VFN55_12435 [Solirubrobacteraceae bacterium]|nr:hypothetical protein [Solirubrobacteraceae bacterium]
MLERHVGSGARVAVIGAGHGNDLPLDRLAARAGTVDLLDLDRRALRRARSSCRAELRCRVRIVACDVTAGAADRITRAVCLGRPPRSSGRAPGPLAGGGYDVVIGDLLYSQLLYPALLDAGVGAARTRQALARLGPGLTDAVVSRMHASARPGGRVVHLHDAVGWWAGHEQPVGVGVILAQERLDDALALISTCRQPVGADPRESARRLGAKPIETALWEWPFAADARYLVCATVTEPG